MSPWLGSLYTLVQNWSTWPLVYTADESAFAFRADCVAVETGLLLSLVLSTLPSPT